MSDLSNFPSFAALLQAGDIDSLMSSVGIDLSVLDQASTTPTPTPAPAS